MTPELAELLAWKKVAETTCLCSNWGGRYGGKRPCPRCRALAQAQKLEATRKAGMR